MKFRSRLPGTMTMAMMMAIGLAAVRTAQAVEDEGFYVTAALGQARHDVGLSGGMLIAPASLQFVFLATPDSIEVEQDVGSGQVAIGYRFDEHFAAEIAWMDFGSVDVVERYDLGPGFSPFLPAQLTRRYTSSVSGPATSLLGSLPLGAGFDIFARAGYLFADRKIEERFLRGVNSMTIDSGTWLGGVGAGWSFAESWAVRLEYQRSGEMDANGRSGESEVEQVSLGIVFRL